MLVLVLVQACGCAIDAGPESFGGALKTGVVLCEMARPEPNERLLITTQSARILSQLPLSCFHTVSTVPPTAKYFFLVWYTSVI